MERRSRQLRIDKIPVDVELAMVGGDIVRARVFVAPQGERSYRRQHVIDLFENPQDFLPACQILPGDVEEWALMNKATVAWASIPLTDGSLPVEEEPEVFEPQLYDIQTSVRVDLDVLASITGQVLYSPPAGHARVVDYLNQPGRFFRLWAIDRLYIVNKAHVRRVVELDDD